MKKRATMLNSNEPPNDLCLVHGRLAVVSLQKLLHDRTENRSDLQEVTLRTDPTRIT